MSNIEPEVVKNIVKDITISQLSSYQIAYKYHLSKNTIDRLGISHLGEVIYNQKEKLAFEALIEQIKVLKNQGFSVTKMSEHLGISKSTMFKIVNRYETDRKEQVQVISVEHPESNQEISEQTSLLPLIENEEPMRRNNFYRHNRYRNNVSSYSDYARIQLNGVQLSFNPKQPQIWETVNKIMSLLQE